MDREDIKNYIRDNLELIITETEHETEKEVEVNLYIEGDLVDSDWITIPIS